MPYKGLVIVAGDAGSCIDLIRPVLCLRKEHHVDVAWIVDAGPQARAGIILDGQGIPYSIRSPRESDRSAYILCGTSTKATAAQFEWTAWAEKHDVDCGWYDDLFVNSVRKDALAYRPREIFCINALARDIVRNIRPDVATVVVGKPGFGILPDAGEIKAIRSRIRAALGMAERDFLVTVGFPGEPAERAVAQFDALQQERSYFSPDVTFAFRFHPAHPQKDELWQRAQASGFRTVDARHEPLADLLFASDVSVASYESTDPYKLVLCEQPVLTMMFPDDRETRLDLGYPEGVPPILVEYEHWGAPNARHLAWQINMLRTRHPRYREVYQQRRAMFRELVELDGTKLLAKHIAQRLAA